MLKATLRSAVLLGLLAWSVPSFAEVQNVKVGGDITVRAFRRTNLDLRQDNPSLDTAAAPAFDGDNFLMNTVGINIGADLTENVGAFIRVANERDWNVDATSGVGGVNGSPTGDVALSQAYITLKELFYAPLTVRIGQQPIKWGRGFVLGSNLLPSVILAPNDRHAAITANEFTDFTAFDAIRATLDLSGVAGLGMPLTADFVYIKQNENKTGRPDDVNVLGFNIGTHMDAMKSELETYYLNVRDKNLALCTATITTSALAGAGASPVGNCNNGSLNTLGFRASSKPAEGANVYTELAYQFGKRITDLEGVLASGDAQQAWAFNLGGDYALGGVATSPTIGAEWRFYSGKDVDGAVTGWRAIAPGYFTTALREFQTRSTISSASFYPNDQIGVTSGQTNQHEFAAYGSLKPIEDLTVNERLSWFWTPVGTIQPTTGSNGKRNNHLGTEWDTVVNYNYTDDVQLGVIYGIFFPGSVFRAAASGVTSGSNAAQELITSVSVKF